MSKKNKLFSWLGFGKDDKQQQAAEQQPDITSDQQQDNTDTSEQEQPQTTPVTEQAEHSAKELQSVVTDVSADLTPQAAVDTDIVAEVEATDISMASTEQPVAEERPSQSKVIAASAAPQKSGFFSRLKQGLAKTSQNLGAGLAGLFSGRKIDADLYEEIETQLLLADVGVATTQKLIRQLEQHADRKALKDPAALFDKLQQDMALLLTDVEKPLLPENAAGPFVILMVGVNGVGKTTTIGKMAQQFKQQGKSVMLAAGDTFRAAAVEQLQVWGERNNIPVIAQHTGADSASVIFDAYNAAKARKADILIADTAGRLQNKAHLMEELKKIVRVLQKIDANAPHEVMLTLDGGTGQNALNQAKVFNEAVALTGISLTKLDGTAKGGVIFAIADQFKLPLRYIGVGEGIDDLRVFNSQDFIQALFNRES